MGYCVFDIESTGLDPQKDRILELGLLVAEDDGSLHIESRFVKTAAPISAEITTITGLTQEDINEKGQDLHQTLTWFQEAIGEREVLVGHNILQFDFPMIIAECQRTVHPLGKHLELICRHHLRDTAAMFKAWKMDAIPRKTDTYYSFSCRVLNSPVKGLKFNLKAACLDLGINLDHLRLHSAGADVVATWKLYEALLQTGEVFHWQPGSFQPGNF